MALYTPTVSELRVAGVVITKKKLVERSILLLSVIVAGAFLIVASMLYDQYLEKTYPKSDLYGTWVEQDVAGYATEKFVLGQAGVSINGGIVDTDYSFNGSYLEYQFGDETRRYKMLNSDFTEMKLVSEPHYQPTFRLVVKYKSNIRER